MTVIRETKLPQIPALTADNVPQVVQALKDIMEVRERTRGQPIDGNVTFRDLVNLNLAKPSSSGAGSSATGVGGPVLAIPAGPDGYNPQADYTTPPKPTSLTATGAFSNVILQWDDATFRNYAYTEIWRSETDALGTAVKVGVSIGNIYGDPVLEGKTYFYWVRFVSAADVTGPYNLTSGTVAATAIRAERILELLRGQITAESLYADLAARINLIDAPDSVPNSVSGRIKDVNFQVAAMLKGMTSAIEQRFQITRDADRALSAQYTVKIDQNGYISGFGLASTLPTEGPATSTFAIRADKFYVGSAYAPEIVSPIIPFVVLTSKTTVNGVEALPGVYMTSAAIQNGSITNLKVGDAAIDDAKIANLSAAKLSVGDGKVGGDLTSQNYVAGSAGWAIKKGGVAEFAASSIRGQLVASQIDTRGLTIQDASGNVILAAGTPLGGNNIIENGHFKDSLVGLSITNFSMSGTIGSGLNLSSSYQVAGEGTPFVSVTGAQAAGNFLDVHIRNGTRYVAVVPGKRYEAYVWLATHRCNGRVIIAWVDADGTYISGVEGNVVAFGGGIQSIADMQQSLVFGVAPSNAAQALIAIRMTGTGESDPYLFLSRVYFGQATSAQTSASPWSPGSGMTAITQANASTYIQAAAIDTAQIKDLAATEAKIGNLAVGNAKIKDYIQSNDYVAGSAGWKIDKYGAAEFSNVTVRGSLRAAKVYTGSQYVDRTSNLQIPATGFGFWNPASIQGDVPRTDDSLYFVGPSLHGTVGYLNRCRGREAGLINEVPFFITVNVELVDDILSLWARYNGGSWQFLTLTKNMTFGYGTAGLSYGMKVDFGVYNSVQFGVGAIDASGNAYNPSEVGIGGMSVQVLMVNL